MDPHAANLLVRATPPTLRDRFWWLPRWLRWGGGSGGPGTGWSWQLVLLDHGLYRQLDDQLRIEYAGLWRSLIFAGGRGGGAGG